MEEHDRLLGDVHVRQGGSIELVILAVAAPLRPVRCVVMTQPQIELFLFQWHDLFLRLVLSQLFPSFRHVDTLVVTGGLFFNES